MNKWDKRFLSLAREVASWSKDVSTKVGAVAVSKDRQYVRLGYNGFPPGDADLESDYLDREIKYGKIIHAEANIIAKWPNLLNYELFTWPFLTCDVCADLVINAGVVRVVTVVGSIEQEARWKKSFDLAVTKYVKAGVIVDIYSEKL